MSIVKSLLLATLFFGFNVFGQTAIESWGQLRVQGPDIVNERGEAIQLQGMSLFWSQWYPQYYEYNTIKWMKDDWCINIIRPAIGVNDDGNYYGGEENGLARARAVIDAAIELDIYVLVDWHAHYATRNKEAAKSFFRTIAQEYGNHPNIIYEIFNEPIGYSWGEIKSYSEEIITEIRKYDPDNIIVCGTPQWSAYPDAVIGNAINQPNIAYTLHYYAASHFQDYRNRANAARGNGLCVFITEYGLVNADGNGGVNESSSHDWWNWMNDNKISHCNWSLCDKDEGASALTPGTQPGGYWNDNQLTWSGGLVRQNLKANCPTYEPRVPTTTNIPGLVEAENYSDRSGIQVETTTDEGGGQNIGYTDAGDFVEYLIRASGSGTYTLTYRVAANEAAEFRVLIDGETAHTINANTGGWQQWEDQQKTLSITAGEHTLRIEAVTSGWNLNYILFEADGIVDCNGDENGTATVDNCDICSGGNTGVTPNACEGGCMSGLSDYGLKDDFTVETSPYNEKGGIYSWGEEDLEGDDNPNFQALISRNISNQTLDAIITQAQSDYVPFGFSFGGEVIQNTVDLSQDASCEIIFTNPSSSDVNVAIAIQDKDGNIINTSSNANGEPFADAWMYGITANVKSGATFTFKNDFTGGFNANYSTESYDADFDYSNVTTLLFTVTNQENTGAPLYAPLALDGITIQIEEMRFGDCSEAYYDNGKDCNGDLNGTASIDQCDICSGGNTGIPVNDCTITGINSEIDPQTLVYPNPTNKVVNFTKEQNWTLFDLLGNQLSVGYGLRIDLTEMSKGTYLVKTDNGMARVIKH